MKKALPGFILFLAVLFFLPDATMAFDAGGGAMIHKTFTLPAAKKGDPFSAYYPFELTGPGEINVLLRVEKLDPKPIVHNLEPIRVVIVDSRAFKKMDPSTWQKFCREVNKYNPVEWIAGDVLRDFVKSVAHFLGKKEKPPVYFHGQIDCGGEGSSESIKHAVDSHELKKTEGRYVVIVRNVEGFKATGGIMIGYPGKDWDFDPAVARFAKVHPDLVVEEAAVNMAGLLEVKLANRGRGVLHQGYWHLPADKAVTLSVQIQGRKQEVPLQVFDPRRALERSGGSVTYAFESLAGAKEGGFIVTIDASGVAFEENENNNAFSPQAAGLKPAGFQPGRTVSAAERKPDLAVTEIRLATGKVIEVIVQNRGRAGVDPALWGAAGSPYLYLKMNGNSWTTIPLNILDPARNLSRPGGSAAYSTGFVLGQGAVIEAFIDAANVLEESDEENNTLQVRLHP